VPTPYYRERLSAALGTTPEQPGLLGEASGSASGACAPHILLMSSHADADKPVVAHLKTLLHDQGITVWSSRQLGRQGRESSRANLHAAMQSTLVMLVILSPAARTSRHIREAIEMAALYQLPLYGIWIEGDHWQDYLPESSPRLAGLTDARERTAPILVGEITTALAEVGLAPPASSIVAADVANVSATIASPAPEPLLQAPPWAPLRRSNLSAGRARLLLGMAAVVVVALVGSAGILTHLRTGTGPTPVHGGTWIEDIQSDPFTFIPTGFQLSDGGLIDQALYLPLFYGDAYGFVHPGAATVVPTVRNGGVSLDARTWTFHLRPHLVWSDGRPYDARDVDFTWRLWANPDFGFTSPETMQLVSSTTVSPDFLTITFHLTQSYAPFLQYWIDGSFAPLPAHYFRAQPGLFGRPGDNLDPPVTSGPFKMAESVPGKYYTLVRNPRYYLASKGLPYLDRVIFRVADQATILKDLQAGAISSASATFSGNLDTSDIQAYQRLTGYSLVPAPTSAAFEALFFDLHNVILSSHPEVRRAIAMAVDQETLIKVALHGFGSLLCTDHPSALHPGYQLNSEVSSECPTFDLDAANKLLSDSGWTKGPDSVRERDGQRWSLSIQPTIAPGAVRLKRFCNAIS
jgi:ABC-type transport system substrate-binding protein